jgi:hypothetical protein
MFKGLLYGTGGRTIGVSSILFSFGGYGYYLEGGF